MALKAVELRSMGRLETRRAGQKPRPTHFAVSPFIQNALKNVPCTLQPANFR